MPTIDTKPRMTVAEIALMREIVRWRRNNGVRYRHLIHTWDGGHGAKAPAVHVSVAGETMGVWRPHADDLRSHWTYLWVESFTQAVDLLVALGYLPPRFSSAYRAGWHAATVWEQHPATARDGWEQEFARLFHDPHNVSFPAGEEL